MEFEDEGKTPSDARERGRGLEFEPGDVLLGQYRFMRELGHGAMGKVMLFEDLALEGQLFALKTVPYVMVGDKQEEKRMRRECKAMLSLSHPGIITVRSLIHDEFHYFLVMDYVDGVTFSAYLDEHPKPGLSVTLEVIRRMAEALDFAHEQNIVHRDVKPENVMVIIEDGHVKTVKLLDFGLSSHIHETLGGMSGTNGIQLDSTPNYMAPELFQMKYGGKKIERPKPTVDQYALGTIAYKMIAGELPFSGSNLFALANNVVTQPVPRINGVPDQINEALLKVLAKQPEDRFENCVSFAEALSAAPSANATHLPSSRRVIVKKPSPQPSVVKTQSSISLPEKRNMALTLPNHVPMELVFVHAGTFMMGSPVNESGRDKDELRHQATLSKDYWLGKYEVTQGQWKAVMGTTLQDQANKAHSGKGRDWIGNIGDDYPMYWVNWNEASEFCRLLTEHERSAGCLPTGYKYTLPTEAQWEYACRAGTSEALYSGDIVILGKRNAPALDVIAWYGGNSSDGYEGMGQDTKDWKEKQYLGGFAGPREVGGKKPNGWGLYDMIGNMCEWCRDWYGGYPSNPVTDPLGASSGSYRVLRGGSWYDAAKCCRPAFRGRDVPTRRCDFIGFRVALSSV